MRKFTFKIMTLLCLVLTLTVACSKDDPASETNQTTTPDTTTPDTTTPDTTTPDTTTPTNDDDGYIIIDGTKREYKKAYATTGHPNYVKIVCEEYDHNIYIDIFGNGQKSPTETTTYKTKSGNPGLTELTSTDLRVVYIQGFFIRSLYGASTSDIESVTITVEGDKMRLTGKEIPMGNGKTMELDIAVPLIK